MMATISPGTASPELGRRICLRTCVAGSTTCSGKAPCLPCCLYCPASNFLETWQQHVIAVKAQLFAEPASVHEAADPVTALPTVHPSVPGKAFARDFKGYHYR